MATRNVASEPASWLLNLKPTPRQRRSAIAVAAALIIGFFAVVPFASTPLPRLDAFIPSVQTATFLTDTITAVLLYSQFSIYRSRALLVLASGYLFTALLIILHVLSFPGAFSPTGLVGSGLQTTAMIYEYWHVGFPLILMIYAWLRYGDREKHTSKVSTQYAIFWSVLFVFCLVGGLVSFAIARDDLMPRIYLDRTHLGPMANYVTALIVLTCLGALISLWPLRRSVFDQWLIVVVVAAILDIGLASLGTARYTLGFYADRVFSVSTAGVVLVVLLAETMRLDARLASANMMLQRERDNKLMNLRAIAEAISHEMRQPLMAITANSGAALQLLELAPPDLQEARSALADVVSDGHRAGEILRNIRDLFDAGESDQEAIDANDTASEALRLVRGELDAHGVTPIFDLATDLPHATGSRAKLQEVIINLLHNAIEAMASYRNSDRRLTIRTKIHNGNSIAVEIEDTGPGIKPEDRDRIFEAFVTTKSGGTGLGLALSRSIIERLSGQLSVLPANPHGAIFRVVLPQMGLPA
jgi:signal transduction histidine kinase